MNWKSLYGIKTKDLRMTSWEGKFNLLGEWQPCNSSAEGFKYRVNWMALFGCRELINVGEGFAAIAR